MNASRIILFSFICLLCSDAIAYMYVSMGVGEYATYLTALLKFSSFLLLLKLALKTEWHKQMPVNAFIIFKLLIAWNTLTIVRGFLTAKSYWDWKYLILDTSLSLLIPYALIIGIMFEYSKNLYAFILTRVFLFGFIIIPLTIKLDPVRELYARGIVISVCFFILLSPYYKLKWRLLTFIVAGVAIYLSFDFRTNVIRIVAATSIFLLFYVKKYIPLSLIKTACIIFVIMPPLFFFLGATGQFNIFKPTDDIDKYEYAYENGDEKNIAVDTRTFLYQEELASMQANKTIIFGEGGAGTYKTEYFEDMVIKDEGRPGSEVGFLNTLLYGGLIGVLLYGGLLLYAVYFAVGYSNNFLCKMLGLFLAFRWVLFFIEDFNRFDMNFYFIWLAAGLCFSRSFRALSDSDITDYFFNLKNGRAVIALPAFKKHKSIQL